MTPYAPYAPLVRIALWILGGWLAGLGFDKDTVSPELIDYVTNDPEFLAAIVWAFASIWYAVAKWRGWST